MSIKAVGIPGASAYEVRTGAGAQTLVINQPTEQTSEGKTIVQTATCGKIQTRKALLDSYVLRTTVKGGAMLSETYFFPQDGGIVRMKFGANGPNGGPEVKNVCRPDYPARKAPVPR